MAPRLDVGIALGYGKDEERLGHVLAADARHAESVGLESLWTGDQLISDLASMPDSTLVLATVAAATERIRLGFAVMVLSQRPVAWAAKQIATLQRLSGNRVLLGIGVGDEKHGWDGFRAAGVDHRERGKLTDEALALLPDLVRGKPCVFGGETVRLAPAAPMPPLLFGGRAAAIRRCLRHGGTWMAAIDAPAKVFAQVPGIAEEAASAGVPVPEVVITVGLALGNPTAEDLDRQVRILGAHGLTEAEANATILRGSADDGAEFLASLAEAGATRVVGVPFSGDWHEQTELLGEAAARLPGTTSTAVEPTRGER
ncbi:LLM class flavin-dependent oxidoreductase [Amycolatopsis sp. NPDC051071]|uniref:LLM class flavin-dependent oxidoreductase n=1 Tax=Amycolatopsis sp. NPDC051071 TaxID=3154637 RepID=UPI0034160AD0